MSGSKSAPTRNSAWRLWDADILIWASTQVTEALDRGLKPSRKIKFHPYNLLRSIRRSTGGADYTRLRAALERLTHTAVRTNIRTDGKEKFASFHWLESWTETIDEATSEPRSPASRTTRSLAKSSPSPTATR